MTAYERSGWRDEEISKRHRVWGDDCPATDIDFLMEEYDHAEPVGMIDYKRYSRSLEDIYSDDANSRAQSRLYNRFGVSLPFCIVRYWPDNWAMKVHPVNPAARIAVQGLRVPLESDGLRVWWCMTELEYVTWLYVIRGRQIPESIASRLSSVRPPVGAAVSFPQEFWFAAKSPTWLPYPCRCWERGGRDCGGTWCPCWGRRDLASVPVQCCARRNMKVIQEIQAEGRRLLARAVDVSLGRVVG